MAHCTCKNCGAEYDYLPFGNFMTFCPNCHDLDHLVCDYGFGPVVPCTIHNGKECIGLVDYYNGEQFIYHLTSQKYQLDIVLKEHYLKALYEAKDIIAKYLE